MRNFFFIVLFLFIDISAFSQETYLVIFKDKENSVYSTQSPNVYLSDRALRRRHRYGIKITERDLPPNPNYIQTLKNLGVDILYKSKWLNAVLVRNISSNLAAISALPFVKGTFTQGDIKSTANSTLSVATSEFYGLSSSQNKIFGADQMHNSGIHGENMWIALIDAGFLNANKHKTLKKVFAENRIIGTWDYVDHETNVYDNESHGLMVLSTLGGYTPDTLIGVAYNASFLLLRTEVVSSESRLEEANWLFAAEKADSVGVDIISSSLGYSTFDVATQNYSYADMNGHNALSTQAAEWAAQTGMLVVVSAGNEGSNAWHYISAPSDADSVISVGAVMPNGAKATFSSYGPSADNRIKPDLVAQGTNVVVAEPSGGFTYSSGTSFSAPLLAGLAAGFWQAHPRLNAFNVIQNLKKSASQAKNPDNILGYGIPNFQNAMLLTSGCSCGSN